MNMQETIREMNQALVLAKEEAQRVVAQEIRDMLAEHGPRFAKRLKRMIDRPRRKPGDEIRAAIAESILDDRATAARTYLRSIGDAHLKRFLYRYMVDRAKAMGAIAIAEFVDDLLETAKLVIPNYPDIARPALPRRCDLSRMLSRHCRGSRR